MDLKTYAVHRKLHHGDKLLDYVVKNEPVPPEVIAAAFGDQIRAMEDTVAERLIADYPAMLGENIPVRSSRNAEGGYDIVGDIPDSVVDAIFQVHGASPEAVVQALVDYNLSTVHGQPCKILNTQTHESAEQTLFGFLSIPVVTSVRNFQPLGTDVPAQEALTEDELSTLCGGIANSMDDTGPGIEESILDGDVPEPGLTGMDDTGPGIEESVLEPELTGMDDEFTGMDDGFTGMDDTGLGAEESVPEMELTGMDGGEKIPLEEAQSAPNFESLIRQIYDRFCADLRAYHLDTRLNLAM